MDLNYDFEGFKKAFIVFIVVCMVIAKYVGMPLLIGACVFLVVGVPIGIISFLPYFLLKFLVSPVMRLINKIPLLGRIVTSLLSIVVSIPIAVAIFCLLMIPLFFGLVTGLDYNSSIKGTVLSDVPFWRWFDWAFRWLDMGHVWPGGDEMLFLGLLKCVLLAPFLAVINGIPLVGALATLGWGLEMVVCPGKEED